MNNNSNPNNKAWLVSVDMGYGHQRAAFPLREMAEGREVIYANNYGGMPEKDRKVWEASRRSYETVSRLKKIPGIGEVIFFIFDQFQKIKDFYPKRSLKKPSLQLRQIISLIEGGWGKDLVEKLKSKNLKLGRNLPFITTFFVPAFMAEYFGYPGEIFCVICDSDVSRAWAPMNPGKSRVKYLAPNNRVIARLKLYGVKPENIYFTGFPLPGENIKDENSDFLRNDLASRILNLDPQKRYRRLYNPLIKEHLGELPAVSNHPLTIMFAVGGAGAQKEIGKKILRSLALEIRLKKIKFILVAGTKPDVRDYFKKIIAAEKMQLEENIEILYEEKIENYFGRFNKSLRVTDILWTKPSELSFYVALGLPIIIAPPVGSQEKFNKDWLLRMGSAVPQGNINCIGQWFFDLLNEGILAEAAFQGFIEGERGGVFNIKEAVFRR